MREMIPVSILRFVERPDGVVGQRKVRVLQQRWIPRGDAMVGAVDHQKLGPHDEWRDVPLVAEEETKAISDDPLPEELIMLGSAVYHAIKAEQDGLATIVRYNPENRRFVIGQGMGASIVRIRHRL